MVLGGADGRQCLVTLGEGDHYFFFANSNLWPIFLLQIKILGEGSVFGEIALLGVAGINRWK